MARIFRATEAASGREVAIKLFDGFAENPSGVAAAMRREAAAAARLPRSSASSAFRLAAAEQAVCVTAGDASWPALVCPLAVGEPLGPWLLRGPRAGERVRVVDAFLAALAAVHEVGIAHNDLSLGNILVDGECVTVIDFDRSTTGTDAVGPSRDGGPGAFYDGGPGAACTGPAHDLRAAAILLCLIMAEAHPFVEDMAPLLANRWTGPSPFRREPACPAFAGVGLDASAVERWLLGALRLEAAVSAAGLIADSPLRDARHG